MDYLVFTPECTLDAAIDKVRANELTNNEINDKSRPRTSKSGARPYERRYDTVDVQCLFAGGAQMRVVSWVIWLQHCRG